MRRRTPALAALMAMIGAPLLLLAPAAWAQTDGYPPPATCEVTQQDLGDLGDVEVGDTISVTLRGTCLFEPGSTINVVFEGQAAGTKVANADGSVTVSVTVTSSTEVSVNPVVRSKCGPNRLSVSGPADVGGATVTKTGTVDIVCPGAAPPATPVRGRVAFTGGNILRWGAVALFLVAVGAGLVTAERRRGRKRA